MIWSAHGSARQQPRPCSRPSSTCTRPLATTSPSSALPARTHIIPPSLLFFQNGAKHTPTPDFAPPSLLFFSKWPKQNPELRCVLLSDPSTLGAVGPNQNRSQNPRMKKCTPLRNNNNSIIIITGPYSLPCAMAHTVLFVGNLRHFPAPRASRRQDSCGLFSWSLTYRGYT